MSSGVGGSQARSPPHSVSQLVLSSLTSANCSTNTPTVSVTTQRTPLHPPKAARHQLRRSLSYQFGRNDTAGSVLSRQDEAAEPRQALALWPVGEALQGGQAGLDVTVGLGLALGHDRVEVEGRAHGLSAAALDG